MTARSSNCSVTAALLSMLVRKTLFQKWQKNYFHKNQNFAQILLLLIDLVIKQLNLLVFGRLLWKISSHWSSQRNVVFDLERAQASEHCYIYLYFALLPQLLETFKQMTITKLIQAKCKSKVNEILYIINLSENMFGKLFVIQINNTH